MSERPQLRAADSDRDAAAAELREHFAAGRLDEHELSRRLETAYAATTLAQLEALRADLPDPRPLPVPATPRELARRRIYQDAGAVVLADVACVVVWAATGAGSFWPEWVILVSALRIAQDAWRLLGPASDTGGARDRSVRADERRERRRRRRGLL